MYKFLKGNTAVFIYLLYLIIVIFNLNSCYFWDNIAITSKEAHLFFDGDITNMFTQSKQPFIGAVTAALWSLFGYKLWVSHVLILVFSFFLIYNTQKLVELLKLNQYTGLIVLIPLTEPTILSQILIASPDVLLLAFFVMGLRALLEENKIQLAISIIFLGLISNRGMFASAVLFLTYFVVNFIYAKEKGFFAWIYSNVIPILAVVISLSYNVIMLTARKWEIVTPEYSNHYLPPASVSQIIRHGAEFALRLFENGRIFMFVLAAFVLYHFLKKKNKLTDYERILLIVFAAHLSIYVVFIFVSSMPFSARYFMPFYFTLSLLIFSLLQRTILNKQVKLIATLIVVFQFTGNLWVYPDVVAKSWDCTLAHYPYYELRNECFAYIDEKQIDYAEVSGGFCFYSDRRYVELLEGNKLVNSDQSRKYYIYSNISNPTDEEVALFSDRTKWEVEKSFSKWPVKVVLYRQKK